MWLTLTENPEIIQTIYKDKIPSLEKIYLKEVKMEIGEDLTCYLKFDIDTLPNILPDKWLIRNVNTVQVSLILINSKINFLSLGGGNLYGKLEIDLQKDNRIISFIVNQESVFVIESKWLNIQSVTGYKR